MNDFNRVDAPFIVFEGIDGSGKDLLCHSVVEDFSKGGFGSRGFWASWFWVFVVLVFVVLGFLKINR